MSAIVLPELAAASVETAERLGRLSSEAGLDAAEAEYILAFGLATMQRLPHLWPIVKRQIGSGMTAATAHQLLARLLEAVDKNLALAGKLQEPNRPAGGEAGSAPHAAAGLAAAARELLDIRAQAVALLRVVDAPRRWPTEEQLREAKEQLRAGERLTAEECRRAFLDE